VDRRPWVLLALAGTAAALSGCQDDATAPQPTRNPFAKLSAPERAALAAEVRTLAAGRGVTPLARPAPVRPELVRLGRALAFDKILSGNRDISCMTCHLPAFATGDGRSLSVGQGATGLGPQRVHPAGTFIPRNAPPLFNLAAMNGLFWDGRVFKGADGLVHTPAADDVTPPMQSTFEFGAISALPLFPVANREEMRAAGGNELALFGDDDFQGIWRALMRRLGNYPEYRAMFEAAYPRTRFRDMTFAHASNAIAGFLIEQFSSTDSPWDQFLAGDNRALTDEQLEGAKVFMSIRCSLCHNGPAFTDGKFHNVALAQFGPGKGNGPSGRDDFGRFNVSGLGPEKYAFRTTPLRNVELTGPYGHAGQFTDLRAFIDHYGESHLKLRNYDVSQLEPALQGTLLDNVDDILATRDPILDGVVLPSDVVDKLTAYMRALTDGAASDLSRVTPDRVPSGLPLDRP
jgi:cytochrome c peroxidase